MSPFDELDELKKQLLLDRKQLAQVSVRVTALAHENPGNAWLCAEIGGIFDSAGFEVEACNWYEQALALGEDHFPQEQRCDFYIWYGSTLRNVGRLADSEYVLREALRRWPRSSALQFFLALTLKSQSRGNESISMLTALHKELSLQKV
jgi:tetratricopeptide (TPR) repeat protein